MADTSLEAELTEARAKLTGLRQELILAEAGIVPEVTA
jgi:hypothetical protein